MSSNDRLEVSSLAVLPASDDRVLCPVLHPVLGDVEIMEDLRAAGGGARQQSLVCFSPQPFLSVGRHFTRHVSLSPVVQPGLKALVEACVHPLVRLGKHTDKKNTA